MVEKELGMGGLQKMLKPLYSSQEVNSKFAVASHINALKPSPKMAQVKQESILQEQQSHIGPK